MHAAACYIDGLPESPIDKVTFKNVSMNYDPQAKPFVPAMQNDAVPRLKMGLYFNNVRSVCIDDVTIEGAQGDALITPNCEEVKAQGLREVHG